MDKNNLKLTDDEVIELYKFFNGEWHGCDNIVNFKNKIDEEYDKIKEDK